MRALVTGCAGFIGSHLAEALLRDGASVLGVDCFNDNYQRAAKLRNLDYEAKDWEYFDFVPIDLSRAGLDELVADCDVIFHLAAEPGVRSSWGERFERYLENNVVATQKLLETLKEWPDKRLVFASSSSIYGDAERFPTPETTIPSPLSPYGATKVTAEHLCRLYTANYGLDTVILRYFTVYGPRQRPDMAFYRFCLAALENRPITVFGDGRQTRDFTYVADIVAATLAASTADVIPARAYNIGGGSQTSVRDALNKISNIAEAELEVVYTASEAGDVRHTSAESGRARNELGFAPSTSLENGLAAEFEWLRQTISEAKAARRP